MSPGTSRLDGRRCLSPPRRTTASLVMALARASMAFRALDSCTKPMRALTKTTPKMTAASTYSRRKRVTTVATSKMITRGWLNCRRKRTMGP